MSVDPTEEVQEERPPIAPPLKLVKFRTISKGVGWWSAVVMVESWGKKIVSLYLWQRKDKEWRRKQKFTIRNKENWHAIHTGVDAFLNEVKE
ncbi:MAG: hypothetical protein HYY14_06280 [Candidatus Omnitrophica bacterium]|nr:hypothetical protein [Candidatus Omnitrophota bacterium]